MKTRPASARRLLDSAPWIRKPFSRDNRLIVVLVVFSLVAGAVRPTFLTWTNLALILASAAVLGVLALGEFVVIITGAIDISIGVICGISALTLSYTLGVGFPPVLAVLVAVIAAMASGAINGALVGWARIPSVVVTLATTSLFLWVMVTLTGGASSSAGHEHLGWLTSRGRVGVPLSVAVFFGTAILLSVLASHTQFGRQLYEVGANEAAARVAGVDVRRVRILTFVLAGALAGVAGVLLGSQLAYVTALTGGGLVFLGIGAVVLGGTNLFGGSGLVRGVVTGVLLLYAIYNAMVLLRVPSAWQDAVAGALILVAVIFDTLGRRAK
jgi:ribose/xylose/arabinose/galactoside ABC-type transport system permease subunit